jgi:hypothetical protein
VANFDNTAETKFRRGLADDLLPHEPSVLDPHHTVHDTRTAGRRVEGLWQ